MTFKKHYEIEDIQELVQWYEQHFNELPESLHINEGTYIKNMRVTIGSFIQYANRFALTTSFRGHLNQFFILRNEIIKYWEAQKNGADTH